MRFTFRLTVADTEMRSDPKQGVIELWWKNSAKKYECISFMTYEQIVVGVSWYRNFLRISARKERRRTAFPSGIRSSDCRGFCRTWLETLRAWNRPLGKWNPPL
jgi:hypothetical protein